MAKIKNLAVYLTTYIDDWSVDEVRQQIIDSQENLIDLYISSNGGNVDKGFELANFIEGVNNKEIHTHILSNADSIATVIFLAPPKEQRHAVASSSFMIHNPKAGIMFADLDEEDAKNLENQLQVAKTRILNYYENKFPNLSRDQLSDFMDNDTYMTAEELLEYGAIDKVLESFDIAAYNKDYLNKNRKNMKLFNNKKTAINSIKLDNGNQLIFEGELAEGVELRNLGDPESLEGDHTLDDGRKISVDKDNKITAIAKAENDNADAGADAGADNADAGNADAGADAGDAGADAGDAGEGDDNPENPVKAEDLEAVKAEVNQKIDTVKTELTKTINTAINGLKKNISSNFKPGKNLRIQNDKNEDISDVHESIESKVNEIAEARKGSKVTIQ